MRHARKRLRGTVVDVDPARDVVFVRRRGSGLVEAVPFEKIVGGRGWRPWGGHAQMSRERAPEQIKALRERGGYALPGPSMAEIAAGNSSRPATRRQAKRRRRFVDRQGRRRG